MRNAEKNISETLQSIQNQSSPQWRCIIIDDSSCDDSAEIVNNYIKNDDRFNLVHRESYTVKSGANICRNIGLQQSCSQNLIFMDSDDILLTDCIKNRLKTIDSFPDKDIYVFQTNFMNDNAEIIGNFKRSSDLISELVIDFIKHKIPWHTMSLVWNKKFLLKLGGWNEEYERLQDVEINLRALFYQTPKMHFSTIDPDSNYRSINMNLEKKKASKRGFIRITKDFFPYVLESDLFSSAQRVDILEYLSKEIQTYLVDYLANRTNRDKEWESLYLNMLKSVGIEQKDIQRVKILFKKIGQ